MFAKWIEQDGRFSFALSDNGGVEIPDERHAALLAAEASGKRIEPNENGAPVAVDPPAPTNDQIVAALTAGVQKHLDDAARTLGYDDIKSAVTYAEEPAVPKFRAEGQAFRAWRSLVWAKCYAIMDGVLNGLRPVPTKDELIAELPVLERPQ